MQLYKLTDRNHRTYNGECQWGEGVTHIIDSELRNKILCSNGVIHAYRTVELGLLLNPIHAEIKNPVLWGASGEIIVEDWGKVGCHELTTIKILPLPDWYLDEGQRRKVQVQVAILCAESALQYFEKWNPYDDRPRKAIEAAKEYLRTMSADAARAAARAAAYAATDAAARAAADAAHAAAYAAHAAAYAAADAADAAADAADAAAYAATRAAANAAHAADAVADAAKIDFNILAQKAIQGSQENDG